MRIGPYTLTGNLWLAPMAGISDRPFRNLCRRLGAGLAVSEMVTSNAALYASRKTRDRANHVGENGLRVVQIVGSEPEAMADAARHNVRLGADIIDINLGCPARKVCHALAGSALMRDEARVARILSAVVRAVPETPVTLKTRLGWDNANRNVANIARIAEDAGIQALTIHGRTRCQGYGGAAEYDLIGEVKRQLRIPVIANGDIVSPEKAAQVLAQTGVDALMIGRGAQGRPWLFREIEHFLKTGRLLAPPSIDEIGAVLLEHLRDLHAFYGEYAGVRLARKHIAWYMRDLPVTAEWRRVVNAAESGDAQIAWVADYFADARSNGVADGALRLNAGT